MGYARKIKIILDLLRGRYGRPPALVKSDPIDEIIRTVLSQNTSDTNSLGAFSVLKSNYRSWDSMLKEPNSKIARLIRHAGLGNIKARRLKEILTEIKLREGRLSLSSLKDRSIKESLCYLRSLKGVGPKTAACVLLFSFAKPTMPVDTHIFRVTKRLGLIDKDLDIELAHEALSAMVPKGLIYEFHLGIIEHGRKTCRAQAPKCGSCVLYDLCEFKLKYQYKKKETG